MHPAHKSCQLDKEGPFFVSHKNDSQAEVREYEPWLALDGGQGPGLDSLTVICCEASHMLQPGGFLAVETTGMHSQKQQYQHV